MKLRTYQSVYKQNHRQRGNKGQTKQVREKNLRGGRSRDNYFQGMEWEMNEMSIESFRKVIQKVERELVARQQ